MGKYNKQRLFEVMGRLDKTFNPNENTYQSIISNFPGHAKETNPIDSPQYKWYETVMKFMTDNNDIYRKAELVKFFQNDFLGMDYGDLNDEELVNWWLSPEQQEFIKGELNSNLNETGEWSGDKDDVAWMESLQNAVNTIATETGGKLKLIDVRGFDKYQGPYAIVNIDGKKYNVWTMEDQGVLWIENFPYDNTSGEGTKAGFEGTIPEIVNVINNTGSAPRNQMHKGFSLNEDSDFQRKINNGDVWLDYYAPSDSEEYTDGQTFYNRSGQQLRDPEEYDPNGEGYTPFGDEG